MSGTGRGRGRAGRDGPYRLYASAPLRWRTPPEPVQDPFHACISL